MKKLHCSVFFLLILSSVIFTPAFAQTYNFRLLLHGTKEVGNSNLGLATWVVCPNVSSNPQKWFAVVGPRYNGDNFWIEVMGGFFTEKGVSTPLLDIRVNSTHEEFSRFVNLQWINPGKFNSFYLFSDINYRLPWDIGSIGIETEDNFGSSGTTLSMGPHLVMPFNKLTIVMAYQFHDPGSNQVWCRAIFNF